MTKLEQEIARHIEDEYEGEANGASSEYYDKLGRLAAEVAKQWIEKAWEASHTHWKEGYMDWFTEAGITAPDKEKWMKENGLTEW